MTATPDTPLHTTSTHDGRHTIATRYRDDGSGDAVVLLHGGLESGAAWHTTAMALADRRRVLRPDRRGHGHTADVPGPYRYEDMARETLTFVERVVKAPAHLVGYSDGGTAALLAARMRPDLVRSMVLIGTHWHPDGLMPAMADRLRHPDPLARPLAAMREAHAAASPDGAAHWETVHRKVSEMALSGPHLTTADLREIATPTLVVVGDDDVLSFAHTVALYESLPDARLAVVPATSHLLPVEAPDALLSLVRGFLDGDEPRRLMPMRHAPPARGT